MRPNQAIPDQELFSTSYTFADTLELMYLETKHEPYRTMALQWVRAVQRTHPWTAWAYAIDAALTEPGKRIEAIAAVLKLDRHSARLAKIPEPERAAAQQWLKEHDPFESKKRRVRPFETPA
jgi:hypothetical protein